MDQFVEKDTERPDVKGMVMCLVLDHLWSHVLKSSTKSISLLTMIRLNAPPKITNLDNVTLLNEYILRLNISVNKPLLMHVINTRAHLNEKVKSSVFAKILLFSNQIEEIALASVLERKINGLFVLKTSIESTNVFVI